MRQYVLASWCQGDSLYQLPKNQDSFVLEHPRTVRWHLVVQVVLLIDEVADDEGHDVAPNRVNTAERPFCVVLSWTTQNSPGNNDRTDNEQEHEICQEITHCHAAQTRKHCCAGPRENDPRHGK